MKLFRYVIVCAVLVAALIDFLRSPAALADRNGCDLWDSCESNTGSASRDPVQQLESAQDIAPITAAEAATSSAPTPTKLQSDLDVCVLLADPEVRLNCYDTATGRRPAAPRPQSSVRTLTPVAEVRQLTSTPGPVHDRSIAPPKAQPDPLLECARIKEPAKQLECFDGVEK